MMKRLFLIFQALAFVQYSYCQSYPVFGNEIPVSILGDTVSDAMEPFISPDGNTLFFNSLNNGTTTSLYYSTRVNDSTFTFMGPLTGANIANPHLDAVASLDSANGFFWVTTRNYPATYHNLFHGVFTGNSVNDTGRVYGTIYIYTPGWLIMDAAIDYNSDFLYYANAYFNTCGASPCISQLGIGQKVNDSTYNKLPNSDALLKNINDTSYLVYAENVTKDGLELYYTRIKKSAPATEICVAVRNTPADTFSLPAVVYADPAYIEEAPTLTTNKAILYYHKKETTNYKIYMRYRVGTTGVKQMADYSVVKIYPNPTSGMVHIYFQNNNEVTETKLYDMFGQLKLDGRNVTQVDMAGYASGVYIMVNQDCKGVWVNKITKL